MEYKRDEGSEGSDYYNHNTSSEGNVEYGELYIKTLTNEEKDQNTPEEDEFFAFGVFVKAEEEDIELGYFWDPELAKLFLESVKNNKTIFEKIKQFQ